MLIKTIGIIGDSLEKPELNKIAYELGSLIAKQGYTLISGGREGVMGSASKGAKSFKSRHEDAKVIGILPGIDKKEGNENLDYAISTGIGWARNQIVVLSSDIVVAIGGGAGTLSEISYAWSYNKPIIAITGVSGWSNNLAGKAVDEKRNDKIIPAKDANEAIEIIKKIFNS
jgi:uncharacterized protein (TIGR00725 family)